MPQLYTPPSSRFCTTGFTLVELVITLILIAILAVTAAPKFFRGGFAEASLQAQLLSRLQLVQTQAMNHYQDCFFLAIETNRYYSGRIDSANTCISAADLLEPVVFSDIQVSQGRVYFDGLGRVRLAESSLCSAFPCVINLAGQENRQIIIESEGYIHAP